MTAIILLIRHAAHAHLGHTLSGRTAGGALTEEGLRQARRLAAHLSAEPIDLVHTSPVLRARQTAEQIATAKGLDARLAGSLDEVDFGEWTGRAFDSLAGDPAWAAWNERRATAGAPKGETMVQVQTRVWNHIRVTAQRGPGKLVAMVSHCDTIRAALASVLGLSLDRILRFEVAPASVSRLEVGSWGARMLSLNEAQA